MSEREMMGLITTKITLSNPLDTRLASLEIEALVDTGALHLCIPEHVAVQLKLQTVQEREVSFADGQRKVCPYVGPVEVEFGNRTCFVGALVLGNEVLLGAVPMEDLDLVISSANRSVVVNPDTPNIAGSIAK